jgi:DNA-directed RNA polymerase specialized sigma subunit
MKQVFVTYEQRRMYHMADLPPELPLNEYIIEYKRTGDGVWLDYFLHRFEEQMLNGWAFKLCTKYNQLSRFQDVKQEMLTALIQKLPEYDPTVGTTLIQFAGRDMVNAVHEYIRKNAGLYLLSDKYYQNLRKVNAIYNRNRDELTPEERFQNVISETDFTVKQTLGYIEAGKWFSNPESLEQSLSDFERAKRTPNDYDSPETVLLRREFELTYIQAVDALPLADRELLFDCLGIDSLVTGNIKPKFPMGDIADKHQLRDEQSVSARLGKICRVLREELRKQGWI